MITRFLQVSACVLIDADGRILLTTRPEGKAMAGFYEFPGGKIDAGETPEQALVRELREELGIETSESCLSPFSFVSYSFGPAHADYHDAHVVVLLYICRKWKGIVQPLEGQTCHWVRVHQLSEYRLLEGNIPFIAPLIDLLGGRA